METAHILGLLGFAVKAGRVTVGVELTCDGLRRSRAEKALRVVVEASDTSANTHKRLTDKTTYYRVPLLRLEADGATLANAVGKRGGIVGAVGVSEPGLASAILAKAGVRPDTV